MSNDDEFILGCAVRYCLNRSSYAPHLLMDIMEKRLHDISSNGLRSILRDIYKELPFGLGMDIDEERWKLFASRVENELKQRGE